MAPSLEHASATAPGTDENESSISPPTSHEDTHQSTTSPPSRVDVAGARVHKEPPKKTNSLRSSIPSFVPTSQVVKLQAKMNKLRDIFTPTSTPSQTPPRSQTSTSTPTESADKYAGNKVSSTAQAFTTAKTATSLFPPTNPEVDGDECLHDCESCTVSLPRKWSIDESDSLYGHVKGWDYHVIVATGKTDWVRDVIDEKGSLMEGLGIYGLEIAPKQHVENGIVNGGGGDGSGSNSKRRRVMLSASNMPTGSDDHSTEYEDNGRTNVMLLPSWKLAERVSTQEIPWLVDEVVARGPGNLDRIRTENETVSLEALEQRPPNIDSLEISTTAAENATSSETTQEPPHSESTTTNTTDANIPNPKSIPQSELKTNTPGQISQSQRIPQGVALKPIPHKALILMCSHKTRDSRCGQSAPLLHREFHRHLSSLNLYRDIHDTRPNGVGIYFINHVGGHKYSANVIIYRRGGFSSASTTSSSDEVNNEKQGETKEAVQGIWLARVRPEDCENIVRYTVLQGKVVKPLRQLRGGFDRSCGLASW